MPYTPIASAPGGRLLKWPVLVACAVLLAPPALQAVPVTVELQHSDANGASFSWLHAATGAKMTAGGVDYFRSGVANRIGVAPNNTLSGEISLDALIFGDLAGEIAISNEGSGTFDSIYESLLLSNGDFDFTSLSEGDRVGSIDYELVLTGGSTDDTANSSGTFYFDYYNFSGPDSSLLTGPNNIVVDYNTGTFDIQLWGNNYGQNSPLPSGASPLGIDLRLAGLIPTSPGPNLPVGGSTGLLLALPLGLLLLGKRRLSRMLLK